MMITEAILLSAITVLGGGGITVFKQYIEGKAQAEIETIRSRAAHLEERLEGETEENDELRAELKELKAEIDRLEQKLADLNHEYWKLQLENQKLKLALLRAMESSGIPIEQFNEVIASLSDEG